MADSLARAGEKQMLAGWLDFHRSTLERKCEGLTADRLRIRAVPPSNLSLLGLVRHMAEVEQHWFKRVLLDERVRSPYSTREHPDADFDDVADADPGAAPAVWYAECEDSRRIVASMNDLDVMAKRDRPGGQVSLRWILVHMIEEYARHNGHADLLRESLDGSTGHLPYP